MDTRKIKQRNQQCLLIQNTPRNKESNLLKIASKKANNYRETWKKIREIQPK
jgi:hypothetical protein